MTRIPVFVIGPVLDRAVMEAFLRRTDGIRIAEEELQSPVRLLVCERSEWLERASNNMAASADAPESGAAGFEAVDCARIVMLTHGDEESLYAAIACGVGLFVGHDDASTALVEGLEPAARGGGYSSPSISEVVTGIIREALAAVPGPTPAHPEWPLTPKEREVAILAAAGWRNAEIARKLFVTPETIKGHLFRTFLKMRIGRRGDLLHAFRHDSAALTEVAKATHARVTGLK